MKRHSTLVAFRFLWIPISAVIFFRLLSTAATAVNGIAYALTEDNFNLWLRFSELELVVLGVVVMFALAHLGFEIAELVSDGYSGRRLLSHFRFGPLAVFAVFLITVPIFDLAMIEISRYQIRSYVYRSGNSVSKPELRPHNNYRHWCGNGASATKEALYFHTAAGGIADDDPYVRARSLLATADVRDFLNGPDPRFRDHVKAACRDTSGIVVETAEALLSRANLTCSKADLIR
jgi:hypothetical protein